MKLKKWLRKNKPVKQSEIDWSEVIRFCEQYIDAIKNGSEGNNEQELAFEAAMKAVYGHEVFNYVCVALGAEKVPE